MKLKTQNRSRVRAEIEGNSNQIKHTELAVQILQGVYIESWGNKLLQ